MNNTIHNPNNELDELLISLEKREKKAFKLYVKQFGDPNALKFVQLYHILLKHPSCTSAKIEELNPSIRRSQIPNLRAELLKHLLESLRYSSQTGLPEAEIRRTMDYAGLLFERGMIHHAVRKVKKARKLAEKHDLLELLFEIAQREKLVELYFSLDLKIDEATELRTLMDGAAKEARLGGSYAGLALELRALYLKNGFARSKEEFDEVNVFFNDRLPKKGTVKSHFQRLHYHRSHFWLNYILQDFKKCYRHTATAIRILSTRDIKHQQISLLKFHDAHLNSLFRMNQPERFTENMRAFEALEHDLTGKQAKWLWQRYHTGHQFNERFLYGQFEGSEEMVTSAKAQVAPLESYTNTLSLKYKMACLLFGDGAFNASLKQLNEILHLEDMSRRKDIHRFARILKLAALLELEDWETLFALVPSTYQYLVRVRDYNEFQRVLLQFLSSMARRNKLPEQEDWVMLKEQMEVVIRNPFQRRPFFYFDIISWLEAKITNRSVAEIIQQRGLGHASTLKGLS